MRPNARGSSGLSGGGRSWPRAATAAQPSTRVQPAGVSSPHGGSMPRGPAAGVETRPKAPGTSLGLARLLRSIAGTAAATGLWPPGTSRPLACGCGAVQPASVTRSIIQVRATHDLMLRVRVEDLWDFSRDLPNSSSSGLVRFSRIGLERGPFHPDWASTG